MSLIDPCGMFPEFHFWYGVGAMPALGDGGAGAGLALHLCPRVTTWQTLWSTTFTPLTTSLPPRYRAPTAAAMRMNCTGGIELLEIPERNHTRRQAMQVNVMLLVHDCIESLYGVFRALYG